METILYGIPLALLAVFGTLSIAEPKLYLEMFDKILMFIIVLCLVVSIWTTTINLTFNSVVQYINIKQLESARKSLPNSSLNNNYLFVAYICLLFYINILNFISSKILKNKNSKLNEK